MFSFFSKKKNTPDISPSDDPIPGANSSNGNSSDNNNIGDDYQFIERRPAPPPPFPQQNNLYPMMPPGYPTPSQHHLQRQSTLGPASYLSDVPFILSDAISVENSFETQQSQIDGILAVMTRSLQISSSFEYDFAVERNIVDQ